MQHIIAVKKEEDGYHHTVETKAEAVRHYVLTGNLALVARVMNIPEVTLRKWKTTEWWADISNDIKIQDKIELSKKLRKLAEMSLDIMDDRLANGDFFYDQKTGNLVRKPLNFKDATAAASQLLEKSFILDKVDQPTSSESKDAKLEQLAEKFASFVQKKLSNDQAVDVIAKEIPNAIHDERPS